MSYIAFLDSNNIVTQIIQSPEDDQDWVKIFADRYDCSCVETTKDGSTRNKYAQIGDTYHADIDAFIEPAPFANWTLNKSAKSWEAPIPKPSDDQLGEGDLHFYWSDISNDWEIMPKSDNFPG
jgi:hypothetical protein